jgi:hypothetical protein
MSHVTSTYLAKGVPKYNSPPTVAPNTETPVSTESQESLVEEKISQHYKVLAEL